MGHQVIGLDNLNDYYDPALKHARLERIKHLTQFRFVKMDLADRDGIANLFKDEKFDRVIHLAAQAGVRYSIENPMAYIDSNLVGTATILEGCRHNKVQHLVYASSSSVYGMNEKMPFSTDDAVDHPVSLYAATKKSNELMAHSYSHLYDLPTTGLRFFTVYGPYGRPDMALHGFTDNIVKGKPIEVFGHGEMSRDFTYVQDIINGVQLLIDKVTQIDTHEIFNIGSGQSVPLMKFVSLIEENLERKADINYVDIHPADIRHTLADITKIKKLGYRPMTNIETGIRDFIGWYKDYYKKN